MKAPFSPHITKKPSRSVWHVNSDPKKLDQMYVRFLGRDGDKLLPEEIKWLAVTHKSFDYGRRGFNDRLAFLGRQAVVLEVAQSILSAPPSPAQSLDNFNAQLPHDVVSREKIEQLAIDVGLDKVLRWKPRLPENLAGSGVQVVLNGAVHAIIGAISLQHGAEVAGKIVRERILSQLALQ
ncbi:54S ribosomal protein L15 like [Verticillium longisporum]|uniref:54S ribosomal protein L15 like n=1 Tax=Verticillium longisporum TaxID=100787 RepID=A0A8I2Z7B1_VERLO|nr:54S ribosomal protein L15 like [Verticillium longisporum]